MKNGQAYQARQNYTARIEAPVSALSAVSRVWKRTEPSAGCKGCIPQQTPVGTAGTIADNFLKHRFLPLYEENLGLKIDESKAGSVLNSLTILASHYPIGLMDTSDKPFPYNVMLAHWHAERQLNKMPGNPELFIAEDESHQVKLATRLTASRSYSLYYIPVLPLYRLLKSREHRIGAQLLLSVFSYLYHIAQIPYYRDADSYLFYHYEILQEWLDEEDGSVDEEDLEFNRRALASAAHGGDIIGRIIYHPVHLEQFGERVTNAMPANAFEQGCLKVAGDALNLWQDHPDGNIFSHLNEPERDEYDEDWSGYDNTIHVGEYIHFIADTESSLYDSIQQNVDAELNEKMYWQEHTLVSLYDENYSPASDSLDYENRLFKLLDDLCYLLNELP